MCYPNIETFWLWTEWKFVKINTNSVFHSKTMFCYYKVTWHLYFQMKAIEYLKQVVYPQYWCPGTNYQTIVAFNWVLFLIMESQYIFTGKPCFFCCHKINFMYVDVYKYCKRKVSHNWCATSNYQNILAIGSVDVLHTLIVPLIMEPWLFCCYKVTLKLFISHVNVHEFLKESNF